MTKNELTTVICEKTGTDYKTAITVIESFMAIVKESLSEKENVYLRGFGSFVVKRRAAKTARNINKNTTVIVPAHDAPVFKPSDNFFINK